MGNNSESSSANSGCVWSAEAQLETIQVAGGIPRRRLGKTGEPVSILGLGGADLGAVKSEGEAVRIIHEALDAGVNFIDNAWEYNDGRSEEVVGKGIHDRREKAFVMTKVCTHGRDAKVAMLQLEESLKRLRTDYLDLWQVHEVVYENDPERHFAAGGVIEALDRAREQGKVRYVGFTGHKSPGIHQKMLAYDYSFDAVQMPLNPFDGTFRSFEQEVLPELNRRGIAPLAMKTLCGTGQAQKQGILTVAETLRYVLSLPIAVLISGIGSRKFLEENLKVAREFTPMSEAEMDALRERCAPYAADGRFELYKTSIKYDADIGREQHGFPLEKELVA